MRLILLLVVVPLVEIFLLIKLSQVTQSWLIPILLTIFTGILGATLARRQGWATFHRIQKEIHDGQIPANAIGDGVMILVAAILLITPGMLTDAFGFSLLIPMARNGYRTLFLRWVKNHARFEQFSEPSTNHEEQDQVIDSYVVNPNRDPSSS